jgi:hypothetical protein
MTQQLVPIPITQNQSRPDSAFNHDINECILEIVRADGEVKLAAERLGVSENDLRTIIAVDPNAPVLMAVHLKALQLLKTFQTLTRTAEILESKLDSLTPYEAAKTHIQMVKLFSELAGNQGDVVPGNMAEAVLKLLPPAVRESVLGLLAKPTG